MTITLSTPADVIAAVPYQIGFTPENSIVVLGIGSQGMSARIDMPTNGDEQVEAAAIIANAVRSNQIPQVMVLGYSDTLAHAAPALRVMADRLNMVSDVVQVLHVRGDQWEEVGTGVTGTVDEHTRSTMAATLTLRGQRAPLQSRDDLVASLAPVDPTPVLEVLDEATATMAATDNLVRWTSDTAARFTTDQTPLSDHEAALLLLAVENLKARDAALFAITREGCSGHVAMWSDLVRRAPERMRTPAAAMLGFSAWLSGNGALAWCALDLIEEGTDYALAGLVTQALTEAIPPSTWWDRGEYDRV